MSGAAVVTTGNSGPGSTSRAIVARRTFMNRYTVRGTVSIR